MARKFTSKKGSKIYDQRKAIVEPVNGQIKEARGLQCFLLRGLEKVHTEWHLIAVTHNLLKQFRITGAKPQGQQQLLRQVQGSVNLSAELEECGVRPLQRLIRQPTHLPPEMTVWDTNYATDVREERPSPLLLVAYQFGAVGPFSPAARFVFQPHPRLFHCHEPTS